MLKWKRKRLRRDRRTFYRNEIDEAAKIDGCGKFAIYLRIIVPLIVLVFIIFFLFQRYIVEGISTSGLKG